MTTNNSASSGVPVKLGIPEDARSWGIIDGTVKPKGIQLTCVHQFKNVVDRHSQMVDGTFDASEMSTSAFIVIRAAGGNQLALPVFYQRGFRQVNIFCRKDSGINKFSDLKGKTIGVTAFYATTIVWVRGILHHTYDVTRDSVKWIATEKNSKDPDSGTIDFTLLNAKRSVLWEMLDRDEIDAAVFPGDNGYFSFNSGGSLTDQIKKRGNLRTIQDDRETISAYYRETSVYPMIHTVTIKQDLSKQHPEVPINLLAALRESRQLAWKYQNEEEKRQMAEEIKFLGYDPYSYELLEGEKKSLNTLMQFMVEDGALKEVLPVESLFAEGTI